MYSFDGRCVTVRALLDQGSEVTLISDKIVQTLSLSRVRQYTRLSGIGGARSLSRYTVQIWIGPAFNSKPTHATTAYVLPKVTQFVSPTVGSLLQWAYLSKLTLADRDPLSSTPFDVIIGADLYGSLLLDGIIRGSSHEPIAQNTVLGWILSGRVLSESCVSKATVHVLQLENIDESLCRFWEIETIPCSKTFTSDELQCENHFVATHAHLFDGRYMVRLPFKSQLPSDFCNSREIAHSCFLLLEKRLHRDPNQLCEYREFLDSYESLNHMKLISNSNLVDNNTSYYIPHHAVLREDSATSHLRVVFNASQKTLSGTSLNEHLLPGPKLQANLAAIILRWRNHKYMLIADIEKMFR